MNMNEYQKLAMRTANKKLKPKEMEMHALHGMVGEIGEIHSLFQKVYQGHDIDAEHLKKEVGDLLWFVAELCETEEWNMADVAALNIEKLKARYPDGFAEINSLIRKEGDI